MAYNWKDLRTTPIDIGGQFQEGYIGGRKKLAGRMAAGGDYMGAASTVTPYDQQAATGYWKMADYQDDKAYGREASQALVRGDYAGAAAAAAARGKPTDALEFQKYGKATKEAEYKRDIERAVGSISNIRAAPAAQRQARYDALLTFAKKKMVDAGLEQEGGPSLFDQFSGEATDAQINALDDLLRKSIGLKKDERKVVTDDLGDRRAYRYEDSADILGYEDVGAKPKTFKEDDADGMSPQKFSRANTLRDEFTQLTSNYRTVESLADRSRKYVQAGQASPLQDIGLVYALAKVYDPTSVVREQEFANVANAGGYGARIKNLVSQAQGRGFDAKTRAELLVAIEKAAAPLREERDRISQEYRSRALALGIDPQFVVDDRTVEPQPTPAPGAPGGGAQPKFIPDPKNPSVFIRNPNVR